MSSPIFMLRTKMHQGLTGFLFALGLGLISLMVTQVAFAQETAPATTETPTQTASPQRPLPFVNKMKAEAQGMRENIAEKRGEIREMRKGAEENLKEMRKEMVGERKDMRASTTEARKEMRGEMRDDRREMASTTRMERKELQEGRRLLASSTREARKEVRDDRREMIKNEVIKNAQMRFELIVKRLGIAIDRLDNISGRIDSRIAKLNADGVDTSTMATLQATAKAKIDAADVAVKAIVAPTLPAETASTTPQIMNELLAGTRAQVKSAEDAIKEAQKALNATVVEMKSKGGDKAEKETATGETNQ